MTLVRREDDGGVATITLDRPEALNAWTPELGHQLLAVVRDASAETGVRAILLRGAGRAFSAGADVKSKRERTADGAPDLSIRLREIYNPIVSELRHAPKPVVAAVQGAAAGLGFSLALAADLIVAAHSASFLLAFVRIGVMPDGGVAGHLAARVGTARAAELMMLGEPLPAARALEWGMVNAVCPDAELDAVAGQLALRLAEGPTVALASMKQALRTSAELPLAEQLELEAALQQRHATTSDYAEGVAAFAQKRPARFSGR